MLNLDEFANSEPVVDPLRYASEEVFPRVGKSDPGIHAVRACADAGRRAFNDDEVLVGALWIEVIDFPSPRSNLKQCLIREGEQRDVTFRVGRALPWRRRILRGF